MNILAKKEKSILSSSLVRYLFTFSILKVIDLNISHQINTFDNIIE